MRYSCRVALCAFFRLCEVPRCGGDHGNSLSSTAAATSPSSTAAWRCLTTPDCAPHSDVRVDSAGTRAIGTTVRSHPQLLNGRLRSTTASCDIIALSMRAPTEVLLAVIATPGVTLLSKRGALQVLLAWKLMCVCPPQKIWGWGGIGLSAASWHYIETSFRPILSPRASTRAQRPREP